MAKRKSTLADLMAAAKLGTIDPSTEVITAAEADKVARKAATEAAKVAEAEAQSTIATVAARALSTTEHECGIPGCRHGSAHPAISQPDRQVKLQCPHGAVARMTARALARAGGRILCGDGAEFAEAPRRTYRKVGA